jgi:hypothetical protein
MSKTSGRHAKEMENDKRKDDIRKQFVCFLDRVFVGLAVGSAAL